MVVIERFELPLFVRMNVCPALVVPAAWFPNVKLGGERLTVCALDRDRIEIADNNVNHNARWKR